jgi:hypothetical protein
VGHAAGTFTPEMPSGDTGANNYVFMNDTEPYMYGQQLVVLRVLFCLQKRR